MKWAIAMSSCGYYEDIGANDHCRDTWLMDARSLGIDYRFFIGHKNDLHKTKNKYAHKNDIQVVDTGDDYSSLHYKSIEKFKWALDAGYDYLYECGTDTFGCIPRLIASGFELYDYYGDFLHEEPRQPWPHGSYNKFCQEGPGYFISHKALQFCVNDIRFDRSTDFDGLVGEVTRAHRDAGHMTIGDGSWRRFVTHWDENDPGPRRNNNIVSCHLSTLPPNKMSWFESRRMYKLWDEWCKDLE